MAECPKIRYRDRLAALIALSNTQRGRRNSTLEARRREIRAYRCRRCHGWHLTSQGKKT